MELHSYPQHHALGCTIAVEVLGVKEEVASQTLLEKKDASRNFQATIVSVSSTENYNFIAFVLDVRAKVWRMEILKNWGNLAA